MKQIIFYSILILAGVIGLSLLASFVLGLGPTSIFAIVLTVIFVLMILFGIILGAIALTRRERFDHRC